MRGAYTRTAEVRHLLADYELGVDKLYRYVKPRKTRARFLEFCCYLRSLDTLPADDPDRDHLQQRQPCT